MDMIMEHHNFKSEIQNLSSNVNKNQEKIKCIENEIQVLQNTHNNLSPLKHPTPSSAYGNIIIELQERMERT